MRLFADRRQPRLWTGAIARSRSSTSGRRRYVDEWVIVANPDVQWGPGSIDALLDAAARWPRAGALGPLIRDPDGSVYPSARHLPSLIRGGMHALLGPVWPSNPWTRPIARSSSSPANGRWAGCRDRACWCAAPRSTEVGGFDERYFMYMEDVDLGDRLGRAGWLSVYVPSAEVLHHKGHSTGRDPAQPPGGPPQEHLHFSRRSASGLVAGPAALDVAGSLAVRSRLMVRSSLRSAEIARD